MPQGHPVPPTAAPKHLLVASTGGHLAQLHRIAGSQGVSDDSLWVTFDTPQSRTLLEGRRVLTVPYVAPRDWRGVLRATGMVLRATRGESFDRAVSTGAALAVSGFLAATIKGVPRLYIESISRVRGPSMTGRLVAGLHLASLQTQHRAWSTSRWVYRDSVLAGYATEPAPEGAGAAVDAVEGLRAGATSTAGTGDVPASLFVALGTIKPYRFDAAVDAVLGTGLASANTVWQLGATTDRELPGRVCGEMSGQEFERCARGAHAVITHAGVGTVMQLLDWGIRPVVLVRRAHRGEHVDDHQTQIADLLRQHDLATVADEPGDLTRSDVMKAATTRVVTLEPSPPSGTLAGSPRAA